MIQPSPDAMQHVQRMLCAIRGLLEEAGMPPDVGLGSVKPPEWVTPPLATAYISLNTVIRGVEDHLALVAAQEQSHG